MVANFEIRKEFTGKEFDTEGSDANGENGMDLYYFGFRYYDPDIIMWTSPDPQEQFWNHYAYSPNPLTTIDPLGLKFFGINVAAATRAFAKAVMGKGKGKGGKSNKSINWVQNTVTNVSQNTLALATFVYAVGKNVSGIASVTPWSVIGSKVITHYSTKTYVEGWHSLTDRSGKIYRGTNECFKYGVRDVTKALRIAKGLRIFGFVAFGISGAFSLAEAVTGYSSRNYLKANTSLLSFGMSALAFAWPWGTAASAGYLALDMAGVWDVGPGKKSSVPTSPFVSPFSITGGKFND